MDANQEAAARLRAILAARQIKARRFAEAVGQSPMWLSRRLNGETEMSINDLHQMSLALDMPMAALLPDAPLDPRLGAVPPSRPAGTGPRPALIPTTAPDGPAPARASA